MKLVVRTVSALGLLVMSAFVHADGISDMDFHVTDGDICWVAPEWQDNNKFDVVDQKVCWVSPEWLD